MCSFFVGIVVSGKGVYFFFEVCISSEHAHWTPACQEPGCEGTACLALLRPLLTLSWQWRASALRELNCRKSASG
jgi:hypothetical protein